jgi:hypothetical protein
VRGAAALNNLSTLMLKFICVDSGSDTFYALLSCADFVVPFWAYKHI